MQCSGCKHVFQSPPPPAKQPPAPLVSSKDVYVSTTGRMIFFGPRPSDPAAAPAPKPPPRPPSELEQLLDRAADALDDEEALLVIADALMERGDPRGRLIAFMLQEEREPDLMRKVKINVLIRDHGAEWTPAGARVTGYHRGFPAELEWTGDSDPLHLAWRTARAIDVSVRGLQLRSVFDRPRPRLRRVTGLSPTFFQHVAWSAPANLEELEGFVHTERLLSDVPKLLSRMPKLRRVTLRTTNDTFDPSLEASHVKAFLTYAASSGLVEARLSAPRLKLTDIDACLNVAPRVEVFFVIPWEDAKGRAISLSVDPRRRRLVIPQGAGENALLSDLVADLAQWFGEKLKLARDR